MEDEDTGTVYMNTETHVPSQARTPFYPVTPLSPTRTREGQREVEKHRKLSKELQEGEGRQTTAGGDDACFPGFVFCFSADATPHTESEAQAQERGRETYVNVVSSVLRGTHTHTHRHTGERETATAKTRAHVKDGDRQSGRVGQQIRRKKRARGKG